MSVSEFYLAQPYPARKKHIFRANVNRSICYKATLMRTPSECVSALGGESDSIRSITIGDPVHPEIRPDICRGCAQSFVLEEARRFGREAGA